MKIRSLIVLLSFVCLSSLARSGPRDAAWSQMEAAVRSGLPRTAIERLEPIIAAALAEQAYPEAIKAIGQKIALTGDLEGGGAEERITAMEAAIAEAPEPMRPVMEAILGHWYWRYFQQNRWRFLQRTATATDAGPDIQTWDLARILEEIDRHFTAALADPGALQAIPIDAYAELLEPGTAPARFRPTLFDFLVHEALTFYQSGEQGARVAVNAFVPEAEGPIFAPVEEFLAWQLPEPAANAPAGRAVQLYQQLLRFHAEDEDRSALLDTDLARLTFGNNLATGENKANRYKAALERFVSDAANHEIAAQALAALAAQFEAEDEPARARDVARRGIERFPDSPGASLCRNLIARLETPSARLETEYVWNAPWPTLDVTYRNVSHVYFRAVPLQFEDQLLRGRWRYGQVDQELLDQALDRSPALAWDAPLPSTDDLKLRTEALPAPTTLAPGYYLVVASHDPNFSTTDNQLSATTVWVSNLALITRQGLDERADGGFVLDASSGQPIQGAQVRTWRQTRNGAFERSGTVRTDENGWFQVRVDARNAYVLGVEHDGQRLATQHALWSHTYQEREDSQRLTVFFTDRALYRPGQSIHYKGIAVRADREDANYTTLPRQRVTVVLRDPNGEEVARADHQTNDYGSFSGVFTAPRDTLMGQMMLGVADGPAGQAFVRVEEYKRPKFRVELDAPAEAAKLGEPLVLKGRAQAYSGASVGGASVRWRVERNVDLPPWCWWLPRVPVTEIAHGVAVTDSDGGFELTFTAEPDRSVSEKSEPVFRFNVYADVTDTTGETRSHQRVIRVGYRAMRAGLSADDWQTPDKPVEFNLSTASLDGDPQPAKGRLIVHRLQQPDRVQRQPLSPSNPWPRPRFSGEEPPPDPSRMESWQLGEVVETKPWTTDAHGVTTVGLPLHAGAYRAILETEDRFGRPVTARHTFQVIDPEATDFPVAIAQRVAAPKWTVEPGTTFTALWGTGYEHGRAFVEIESHGRILKRYWTASDRTQAKIELPVEEAHRGGMTLRITFVRENRAHLFESVIEVPWTDRKLAVKWESFRSKLLPGARETWTAVVSGPDAGPAAAEMAAVLYDASLDQFLPHAWPEKFGVFRQEFSGGRSQFQNTEVHFGQLHHWRGPSFEPVNWSYPTFPHEIIDPASNQVIVLSAFAVASDESRRYKASSTLAGARRQTAMADVAASAAVAQESFIQEMEPPAPAPGDTAVNLDQVSLRQNLNETAFFFPHLLAEKDGTVRMTFTMPEALTEWRFFGFAHDRQLRSGFITGTTVTAKDLMVQPNPPRFLREGDEVEFTVKVSNQSESPLAGKVRLTLVNAETQESVDVALGNEANEQDFSVPAKQSRTYAWRLRIPDGLGVLTYRAVAAAPGLSDGEEGYLPVLSRRILVTESLPLPVRGKGRHKFRFDKLLDSAGSNTLRHQSLTVQMTSQPAWYAVLALPYLMEFPFECSEQVFNRYYANALAAHIARSDPKIRRVFDVWKASSTLPVSPLEQNEDLKAVLLEETPWVRQAKSETQARHHVGLLFDSNRLEDEMSRALRTLAERQSQEGMWAWFPGGRPSEYISLYIATGFGRMRHLGVTDDVEPALKALSGLDAWIVRRHQEIQKQEHPEKHVPTAMEALYLYGRSFFMEDHPLDAKQRAAVDFFLAQAREFWVDVPSRQNQAHLALALQRFGDGATAQAIVRSLKERSVTDDELGRFWRDNAQSWWWYRAPIETQALMIEALDEVAKDAEAVEACKVWLLKQKQTQAWPSTKATADAVYSLLLRGDNLLASDKRVEVALGGTPVQPAKVEAGTGFYEKRFSAAEVEPRMGEITVTKPDTGVSWGGVHWQYLEDIANVTAHEATPLKLTKTLFVKENTDRGPVLQRVNGPVAVGDELVVRLELRTDRDMEFVHLKDQRGSGTEPVDVLSAYRYQDGLGYYMSTRDTATHFFIDDLPRGTYVFEYSTRVQLRGTYQSGVAEIQCMYAPEYNSHSESIALEVE